MGVAEDLADDLAKNSKSTAASIPDRRMRKTARNVSRTTVSRPLATPRKISGF